MCVRVSVPEDELLYDLLFMIWGIIGTRNDLLCVECFECLYIPLIALCYSSMLFILQS